MNVKSCHSIFIFSKFFSSEYSFVASVPISSNLQYIAVTVQFPAADTQYYKPYPCTVAWYGVVVVNTVHCETADTRYATRESSDIWQYGDCRFDVTTRKVYHIYLFSCAITTPFLKHDKPPSKVRAYVK